VSSRIFGAASRITFEGGLIIEAYTHRDLPENGRNFDGRLRICNHAAAVEDVLVQCGGRGSKDLQDVVSHLERRAGNRLHHCIRTE
jgi:hypothetical protein